jgi:hypothetical protein
MKSTYKLSYLHCYAFKRVKRRFIALIIFKCEKSSNYANKSDVSERKMKEEKKTSTTFFLFVIYSHHLTNQIGDESIILLKGFIVKTYAR